MAGCASEPPTRSFGEAPHSASGSIESRPPPLLRALAAAAPDSTICRAHDPTPGELAKQRSVVDPLRMPALYSAVFYGDHDDPLAAFVVDGAQFRPYRRFDNRESGLSGLVLLDDSSGHALILFKGMDRPFAERGGWGGVLTDLGGVLSAKFGTGNSQLFQAEGAYTEALCEEAIKSIEMVGYSMGSQIANYLATKYGAYGVVFGDMGLDTGLFKHYARGDLQAAWAQARERVVSLSLSGDLIVSIFGVGGVVGTVVKLPGGLAGVLHQPEIYAEAANAMLRERDQNANRSGSSGAPAQAGTKARSSSTAVTISRLAGSGASAVSEKRAQ